MRLTVASNNGTLLGHLSDDVVERFARITGLDVVVVPLNLSRLDEVEDAPGNPAHPVCAELTDTAYCRESWQLHLAELKRRSGAHWHECQHGRLCAVVPVVCQERCLAVVRLVCHNTMPRRSFEHHVELLDILVENLVIKEADFLACLLPPNVAEVEAKAYPSQCTGTGRPTGGRPSHPQVLKSLEYIEDHLSEPKLTVRGIALELEIHPDYLAHLFASEVGQRMSRYIAARRIELAKTLLAATSWQIKRIARETGYANPNWFSHVFSVHTGLTPGEHRQQACVERQAGPQRRIS